MHLILKEKEYCIATNDKDATIDLLKKPPSVHPGFQTLKKEELTKYKVLQLEAETKQQTDAYLTQEETAKEIVRRIVTNIDADYIKELNNEYTGYNNKTPKSLLAHISGSYCKTMVTDQLKADSDFAKPWDQVTNLGTWIMQLEQLRRKCEVVGVAINDGRMVLKITENVKKYALFANADHKAYDDLPIHDLDAVIKFWVTKYKAHNTYQRTQAVANQYKSAAYAGPPPNEEAVGNDNATYISALEEAVACLLTERETAYAATNAATTKAAAMSPGNTLATNTLNDFQNQLLTEMRNEMKKVLAAATTAAATGSGARGEDTAKDGGKERWRKTRSNLPLCPHCKRNGKHKPEDCFSLPANADKKPANFIDGRYVNGKKTE
jgi:hypothetical protein